MGEQQPTSLAKLPPRCIARDPASGRLVILVRGTRGFQYMAAEGRSPEAYNGTLGLTYEQVEAMEYGAMFGFEAELADPDYVRRVRQEMGLPVGLIQYKPDAPKPATAAKRPVAPRPAATPPEEVGNFVAWFQESLAQTGRG
ncbi:MAG: hypothetical protein P4L83_16595 [Nevskia sp.]|nr:hypothetical protein [Nevskia sp.]